MADGRNAATVAAINAAISSIPPTDNLYPPAEERGWKVYWARYWCFRSQKRERRVVPAARSDGASGSAREWPTAQGGIALAPPSSPASFVNSTLQSPADFTVSLAAVSASMCSPGRPNTMFTIGPYAHETQLVSPPVFSTFTTEPSTAPFTPPPELAHLTTPSSPDVPFAQYIRSSLEAKRAAREMVSPLSSSTLASPCDTPASYTPTSGHYYLGSPLGKLISPAWGSCSGELISHGKHPLHPKFFVGQAVSSFPTYDPFASASLDGIPHAAFIFPIDTNGKLEETLTSCSGHCDVAFDCGDCPLQEEVVETFACKHGGNSCHNEVSDTIIPADAAISVTTGVGEKSVELQQHESTWRVHFHLPDAHGSLPIEEAHANDGSCAELSSNVISKRGEKLQELLAHDSTEVPGSQCETQQHGTITRGQEHSKICAMDLSQLTDGEYALENEAGRIEAVQNHADPSHMSAIRPVVLELDEASRAIST